MDAVARSVGDGGSAAVLRDRFGGADGFERDCEVRVLRVVPVPAPRWGRSVSTRLGGVALGG